MVLELHRMGYQRLRVAPGLSPSGMHWRCAVLSAGNAGRGHGARLLRHDEAAHYSSSAGANYFGWGDAAQDSPRQLAEKFVSRFPLIAEAGRGPDKPYADWYAEMIRLTEPSGLPYAYADWALPEDRLPVGNDSGATSVQMPPPGEG
jgi:hypothetical protein